MHIDVIIATTDRADIVGETISWLRNQERMPDRVVIVGAAEDDLPSGLEVPFPIVEIIAEKGLCNQRNAGLDFACAKADLVMFFDDDFFAEKHYLANMEEMFTADTDLVGVTGDLIADGAQTGAIGSSEACATLSSYHPVEERNDRSCTWLYGCNMGFRTTACETLRFDTNLPFYGWQEDVDFSARLLEFGKLTRSNALTGIHLGTRRGRTSGLRLGYSQVANVLYLQRKGTMRYYDGWRLMLGNLAANLVGSLRPEPEIDRRGRLRGNAIAFIDLLRGRMDPRRIIAM
ncbi:glycosyltransferase [Altererythrobacter arenosus]|uniref:Glycosyltransferase n=1 Tax=Altererythrobacter arenosus TaxID=3032592 RepID=A0ABY8FTK1_9SPHN|nr:glycosyltransferase family 2 protein [Altererythrobacter sp. CAU 1644]WFL78328.1 glycosyltransferase [Altererythrobacter sp. CAU 1644]